MKFDSDNSLLDPQELELLAFNSQPLASERRIIDNEFPIYTLDSHGPLTQHPHISSSDISQLIVMLTASPKGSAVILPFQVEQDPSLDKLTELLNHRADIKVFWLGRMPGMEFDVPAFEVSTSPDDLAHRLARWQQKRSRTFNAWLEDHRVCLIEEDIENRHQVTSALFELGITCSQQNVETCQLLLINLTAKQVNSVELLSKLVQVENPPILLFYGELPQNILQASHTLARSMGLSVLASLPCDPAAIPWSQLLLTLFSKRYLSHWLSNEEGVATYLPLLDITQDKFAGYFCSANITQQGISQLQISEHELVILDLDTLNAWFPDELNSRLCNKVCEELKLHREQLGILVRKPQLAVPGSDLLPIMVGARLSGAKVCWLINSEQELSMDALQQLPISDIILAEGIANSLLGETSDDLLLFLEEARRQEICLGVQSRPANQAKDAFLLYGIEYIVDKSPHQPNL